MMKHWIRNLSLAVTLTAVSAGPVMAEELKTLNFGIISTEASQNLREIWTPFLDDMSKELGMEVKAFFAPDYAGIIQGMRFNKVDIAWYGNKSAMEAVDRAGGEIFAQTVDSEGHPGYWSHLIVHKDNAAINSVEDVLSNAASLTFSNGDPNSTSGFLVPGYYVFATNNVEAGKIFKRTLNASHETNALSVANKQVDVATFNSESMRRLEVKHPDKAAQLKIIWTSPLIPSDPIVWRKNLPAPLKAKVKDFFMTYGTQSEQQKAVLAELQWAPFRDSNDDQLLPIRQLELFKQKRALEADTKLSEAERAAKLAEIESQLKALEQRQAQLAKQTPAAATL